MPAGQHRHIGMEKNPLLPCFQRHHSALTGRGCLRGSTITVARKFTNACITSTTCSALACGGMIPEASGWFKDEMNSVDQFKGLKMRYLGLGALVLDELGASTQLLAGGDIFPALELGTIDATEFAAPSVDWNLGFWQIVKNYYFPGWHQPATIYDIMINLDRWNALSDAQQAQLEMVCGDNIRQAIALGESMQPDALAMHKSKGVQVHRWSPEILKTLEETWRNVAADLSAKDATFKETYESLTNWQEKYQVWLDLGYLDR